MIIRKLTENDLDAVWNLRLRSLKDNPEAFGATYEETIARGSASFLPRLKQERETFYLGAFDHEQLIGMLWFGREQMLKDRHRGSLYSMYVAPETRGRGVARQLLQELIKLAREIKGLEQVHLNVVTVNEAAYRLYLTLGFQVYGKVPKGLKFEDQYWDEYLMMLDLHTPQITH